MNRNYNENYNNKYNLDPKYIKCANCPKPAELRRNKEGVLITPFKGKNGEELCHKCAPCAKCGKEVGVSYSTGRVSFCKHEKTNDNPSGEWALAYCSKECFDGTEKPSLPEKTNWKNWQNAKCDHCGKLDKIRVGNTFWGKSFCSENCYELAFARIPSPKTRDEISARCCVCNLRIFGEDRNFSEDFKNKKEKVHFSTRSINSFYCSEKCFEKRGDKSGMSGSAFYDHNPTESDNFPKPNPATPQLITNSDNKSDNSVSSSNSPKPNPGKESNLSETKNNVKTIRSEDKDNLANSNEKSPAKNDDKTLIIDLRNVKRISLTAEGNLVIEFKSEKSENNSEIGQVQQITTEEINKNQELQKIKDYFQKTGKSSLNQQELNSLVQNKTGSAPVNSTKPHSSNALWISCGIGGALIIGVVIGLLMKRKSKTKKIKIKN